MSVSSAPYLTGPTFLDFLRETFPGWQVISSTEFREFLNIAPSTDLRMRNLGKYPRTICLPGVMRDPRILLVDLAVWLEQGGCPKTEGVTYRKRGRGSDEWKKNHPPKAETARPDAGKASPARKKAEASKKEAIPAAPQPVATPAPSDADIQPEA